MIRIFLTAAAAVLALTATARAAQSPAAPAAIRPFDLRTTELLGREIWRQDRAAALATDALLKRAPDPAKAGVVGWIVGPPGPSDRVRFLRRSAGALEAAYDVTVERSGEAAVTEPTDRALTAQERTMFAARETAAGALRQGCRPGYNAVVAPDPDGDGWLVWLLAPSPSAKAVPLGGHHRFTVSADGRTIEQRDALSASCLTVDPRQGVPPGGKPLGIVGSHVVSPTPVETHVFLQLLHRLPMYVITGRTMWKIVDGRVAPMEQPPVAAGSPGSR